MRKSKLMGVFLFLTFSLIIFAQANPITIVLASEDEETDEFLVMPDYRWTEVGSTSGTQEKIDNGYEVYASNLEGTSYYRRYRPLNSRDFYFESRFKVDGANNSDVEYWRDVENDFCDFYEDADGWTAYNGSTLALGESALEVAISSANQGINYSFSANDSYYHLFEFRAKSSSAIELNFTFSDVDTHSNTTTLSNEWTDYSFTLGNGTYFNVTEDSNITITTVSSGEVNVYFDYMNLWGQLNATLHFDEDAVINYILNGDNEDGDTGQVYGSGATEDHPEWSIWQGLFNNERGDVLVDGNTQVIKLTDTHGSANLYNGITQTQALDYDEESEYVVSSTLKMTCTNNAALGYSATKFIFKSADGTTIAELRPYIADEATGWTNTSTTLYFPLHVSDAGDTNYYTFNGSLNDIFVDLPALDSTSERTKIAKLQTIEYIYQQQTGGTKDVYGWFDNTTLVKEIETGTYSNDTWGGTGFKWTILNGDLTEGMYIQMSNIGDSYSTSNYSLDVVFPDEYGGQFWNYTTTFEHNPKEWLRIDLEFDIDKVDMNLKIKYDNESTIARLDVFDIEATPTVLPPLFTTLGFPSLSFDARVSPMEHCYFSVGFIDANWLLTHWTEPDSWSDSTWSVDMAQSQDEQFTQDGVYGTSAYVEDSQTLIGDKIFQMDVDRLDGISFDLDMSRTGFYTPATHEVSWYFGVYNVQSDGSLQRIFLLHGGSRYDGSFNKYMLTGYDSDGNTILDFQAEDGDGQDRSTTKISFFHEDSTKAVLQARATYDDAGDESANLNEEFGMSASDLTLTKEYVFRVAYHVDLNVDAIDENPTAEFKILGLDVTRKDILGQIVGMVLGPLIGFVALLLSPLIFFFQILIFVFRQLIGGLSVVFETVVAGLTTFLTPLFEWLSDILEGLVGIGAAFLQSIIDGLGDLLEDFIDALTLLFDVIVEFFAALLFFIWDDFLGLEDFDLLALLAGLIDVALELLILFIELLLQIPPFIVWIIEVWFFYGWILFAIMWALIILVPAMSEDTKSAMDWVDRMLHRMMWNISPGSITLIGVTVFPSKVPLILFLLPATVFTLTGSMLW